MKSIPVIISGGLGTRLWPLSTPETPKPFIRLSDSKSLLQATLGRAISLSNSSDVITITHSDLIEQTLAEYQQFDQSAITHHLIAEPVRRNTASAVAAAALYAQSNFSPDSTLLFLPADHHIKDRSALHNAITAAENLAQQGFIVTFGIKPDRPETGYGYIETDSKHLLNRGYKVRSFTEKPSMSLAEQYIDKGGFYWNSGMFCCRADLLLSELRLHAAELLLAVKGSINQSRPKVVDSVSCLLLDEVHFATAPDISIDYALLEKSDRVAVVPCDPGWSDIGSWDSLSQLSASDSHNNRSEGVTVIHNAQNNFVHNRSKPTALIGVDNLVVVDSNEVLLVAHKDSVQDIKQVASTLRQEGVADSPVSPTVSRVWGTYTIIEQGDGFKVKRIVVRAGASLSLQKHQYRSEHWVVVSGTASVLHEGEKKVLQVNESTFIPAGDKHKLSNSGGSELVIIEVQSGSYLGEDDIERFD